MRNPRSSHGAAEVVSLDPVPGDAETLVGDARGGRAADHPRMAARSGRSARGTRRRALSPRADPARGPARGRGRRLCRSLRSSAFSKPPNSRFSNSHPALGIACAAPPCFDRFSRAVAGRLCLPAGDLEGLCGGKIGAAPCPDRAGEDAGGVARAAGGGGGCRRHEALQGAVDHAAAGPGAGHAEVAAGADRRAGLEAGGCAADRRHERLPEGEAQQKAARLL